MHDDLHDGLKEEIEQGVRFCSTAAGRPYDVLTKTPVESVRIVGIDFRDGILFVPEVLDVDGKGAEIIALPVRAAFATSSPCSAGGTGAGAAAPGRRPNKVGCRGVAGVRTALDPSTS